MKVFKRHWLRLMALTMSAAFFGAASTASAKGVDLDAALGTPVVSAGAKQNAFLKIALTGFELPHHGTRAPVNVAIVLDKSGSMTGEKIIHAREAAIFALDTLDENDIVSVVSYDSMVRVVVPATRVSDKTSIIRAINRIRANGNTALFAGVSKGANEVRKFLERERVNRVILLSDGLANVGPSTPSELGDLGASLGKEGMSVTTIGLGPGYNEDLMTALAGYSDGNHEFAQNAADLARIFQYEFGDAVSVVAQGIDLIIRCEPGVRPMRVLGRQAEITGGTVRMKMNQLGSEQEKFVVLEVEVPPGQPGASRQLAAVDVSYTNMQTQRRDKLTDTVMVAYSDSAEHVDRATNKNVMKSAVEQVANEKSKQAVTLRDEGKVEEAQRLLRENASYLNDNASRYDAPELANQGRQAEQDAEELADDDDWNLKRKSLRAQQYKTETQQSY